MSAAATDASLQNLSENLEAGPLPSRATHHLRYGARSPTASNSRPAITIALLLKRGTFNLHQYAAQRAGARDRQLLQPQPIGDQA
jgi:hypothetical protein